MAVEVGAKVSGKVTGITNFGAFVDLGEGQTGLVHISEVSDEYVKDIHDVLKVGDVVTVKVMSIKDGKVGLSIRKAVDKPQAEHTSRPSSNRPSGDHFQKPRREFNNGGGSRAPRKPVGGKDDFDSLMSGYLKESEERLSSLRRNTEGKRGGRGGRRS
ncbi:S1 domain-containing RNA-binding protein [Lacticaseibacillus mingshuiensis]|uniref:S1 domain-containing RNA-binding protein n=1 Tax=Lacticaseibacillus mingshuiensis TaxID=2799574 RepID=A0ABW4CMZ9_9LACO|nr:S1 domain-containing RNA-binding protein [Lacticaseibacillus mingshuiensis]